MVFPRSIFLAAAERAKYSTAAGAPGRRRGQGGLIVVGLSEGFLTALRSVPFDKLRAGGMTGFGAGAAGSTDRHHVSPLRGWTVFCDHFPALPRWATLFRP